MKTHFDSIPIVDLSRATGSLQQRSLLAEEIRDICHQIGFMVIVNHGIPSPFLDHVFATMQRLFALPQASKQLIDKHQSRHFRGWESVGSEYTNNRPDMREQVDLWTEHEALAPDAVPVWNRLLGPNQWFPEAVLPGYRTMANEWFERCGELAQRITELMSGGLRLPEGELQNLFDGKCMSLTKFIHYPPTPPGAAGVNPHHDAGFLTILAPGLTPGLQVLNPQGDWIDVPVIKDALVVNLGEMLQGMTGNYFVATPHRVITREERYSAGYFHGPPLETPLTPLSLPPELVAAVAASERHSQAGYMALKAENDAGVGDMQSMHRPAVYGEQIWNYFERSYPDLFARYYAGG